MDKIKVLSLALLCSLSISQNRVFSQMLEGTGQIPLQWQVDWTHTGLLPAVRPGGFLPVSPTSTDNIHLITPEGNYEPKIQNTIAAAEASAGSDIISFPGGIYDLSAPNIFVLRNNGTRNHSNIVFRGAGANQSNPNIASIQRKLFVSNRIPVFHSEQFKNNPILRSCNDRNIIIKKGDSTYVITEKEIEKAMHFGAKEKISSIVVGGLFGALIGGFTASLFQRDEWGFGNIKLALYGVSIGSLFGSVANYAIIKHLAIKSAQKRLVEKIKNNPSYEK
jgi:hypothetical protein